MSGEGFRGYAHGYEEDDEVDEDNSYEGFAGPQHGVSDKWIRDRANAGAKSRMKKPGGDLNVGGAAMTANDKSKSLAHSAKRKEKGLPGEHPGSAKSNAKMAGKYKTLSKELNKH
jgi:hypothetical protein